MTDLRVRVSGDVARPESFRLAGWVLLGAAALLLPWMVVLAVSLPAAEPPRHWTSAWIGLDLMEATALALTGWLVLRRDVRVSMVAGAAGAFLLADAWFDITTARGTEDVLEATTLALCVELPLVVLCAALAVTAPRWCDASGRSG